MFDNKRCKKVITECYCKYVPQNKNAELYEEMAELLGIYAYKVKNKIKNFVFDVMVFKIGFEYYTKDKVNIKPYVIIGKDL